MLQADFLCFKSWDLKNIYNIFITDNIHLHLEKIFKPLYFKLFNDSVPKTCDNFKQLVIGNKQETNKFDPPLNLTYKSTIFHRVVKNGWIQGGGL